MSAELWEQIALGFKKGENCQKHMKNTNFRANPSFFSSNSLASQANHPHCSFLIKEQIAHSCSFVKSGVSKLLTVALLYKVIKGKSSWLIFNFFFDLQPTEA